MNVHLFTMILSIGFGLFNLYSYFQQQSSMSLILSGLWLLFAFRSFRHYNANKD